MDSPKLYEPIIIFSKVINSNNTNTSTVSTSSNSKPDGKKPIQEPIKKPVEPDPIDDDEPIGMGLFD